MMPWRLQCIRDSSIYCGYEPRPGCISVNTNIPGKNNLAVFTLLVRNGPDPSEIRSAGIVIITECGMVYRMISKEVSDLTCMYDFLNFIRVFVHELLQA